MIVEMVLLERIRFHNSYSNEYEAKVILKLLRHLINDGVPEESIGICLYKAQAEKIREMLGQEVKTKLATSNPNTDGCDFVQNTIVATKRRKKPQIGLGSGCKL